MPYHNKGRFFDIAVAVTTSLTLEPLIKHFCVYTVITTFKPHVALVVPAKTSVVDKTGLSALGDA